MPSTLLNFILKKYPKTFLLGTFATACGAAILYLDYQRRNSAEYKLNLVRKRRIELENKRIKEDPLHYVKNIELCSVHENSEFLTYFIQDNMTQFSILRWFLGGFESI